MLLEPSLEIFFIDCNLCRLLALIQSRLTLYLGQILGWRAACNILNLALLLGVFLAHLGERFTLEAGSLLLAMLHELFFAQLGLLALLIELGLALALLLALPAE